MLCAVMTSAKSALIRGPGAAAPRTLGPARSARAWSALLARRRARLARLIRLCHAEVDREFAAALERREVGGIDLRVCVARALRRTGRALQVLPRRIGLRTWQGAPDLRLDGEALVAGLRAAVAAGRRRWREECAARRQTAAVVAICAELASESLVRLFPGDRLEAALEVAEALGASPHHLWLAPLGLDAEAERRAAVRFATASNRRLADMALSLAAQAVRNEVARAAHAWAEATIERPLRCRIARLARRGAEGRDFAAAV